MRHKKHILKGNIFSYLPLCIGLFLASCAPQSSTPSTATTPTETTEENRTYKVEKAPVNEAPGPGGKSVVDEVSYRLILESPTGAVLANTDSITVDLVVKSEAHWYLKSFTKLPDFKFEECVTGSGAAMSALVHPCTYNEDSSQATFGVRFTPGTPACESNTVIVGGGLIVVVEESMPDTKGSATFQNVRAWHGNEFTNLLPKD